MKHDGFKNLGLLIVAGLMVGACSPLAPSVSKMANTAGQKSGADGIAPPGGLNSPTSAFSTRTGKASEQQSTQISILSQFRKDWTLIHDSKLSVELEREPVDEFAANATVSFVSNDDRVKGSEETLAASKTVVILVVSGMDAAAITNAGLDQIKTSLKWHADTARWELALIPPSSGDGVKDLNDLKQAKEALLAHLVDIAIEFQTE